MKQEERAKHARNTGREPNIAGRAPQQRKEQKKSPVIILLLLLVILTAAAVLVMLLFGLIRARQTEERTDAAPASETAVQTPPPTPLPTEVPAETPKPEPEAVYRQILEKYAMAAKLKADTQMLADEGLSLMTVYGYGSNGPEHIGYLLQDLDGNDTPELLIGSRTGDAYTDRIVLDLYTIEGDCPVRVFSSEEQNRYYLCPDGVIANEALFSPYEYFYAYLDYSAGELKLREKIGFDMKADKNDPWYREDASGSKTPVSEEEAMQTVNTVKEGYLSPAYTSFSEYNQTS